MEQNTILTKRGRINGYLFFGYQGELLVCMTRFHEGQREEVE